MVVVSNTSPLRYLIAVSRADLLEQIFHHVLIPHAVERELTDARTPAAVRRWMAQRPAWLEPRAPQPPSSELVAGDLRADYLLIDESRGRNIATQRGLVVIGALGIVLEAYRRRLIDNPLEILPDLRAGGFHISRRLAREFERLVGQQ
jgi:predicted nucleic acid-binding protein